MTATWRDVELAGSQGSITSVNLNVPHTLSNWGKGIVQRTTDNGRLVAALPLEAGQWKRIDSAQDRAIWDATCSTL